VFGVRPTNLGSVSLRQSAPLTIVAKIGTSSLTDERGVIDDSTIVRVVGQVAALRAEGHHVLLVTSAAVASGVAALGFDKRPSDVLTLQAVSAVGMSRLMHRWDSAFEQQGIVSGQVLLTPNDFFDRTQYLHARATLTRLVELGVVPVINENDAVASDEIRFGDNDRIAALVAHLVGADVLVLLTDTAGLFTANPKTDPSARLIERVDEVTDDLEAVAGGVGSDRGSGGMSSKLRAAKIASWSGVRAVIAGSKGERALLAAVAGEAGCGTIVSGHDRKLSARKLWIAFAGDSTGSVTVDAGAEDALRLHGVSLLPVGVKSVGGQFMAGDLVDISGPTGRVFARGMVRLDSAAIDAAKGKRTDATDGDPVVHRDDLVILP
jgi:glutamate 5-kinase